MLNIKTFLRTYWNWSCESSIEATRWVVVETQYTSDQILASVRSYNKYHWDSIQCSLKLVILPTDIDVDIFTNFSITQSWSRTVGTTNSTKTDYKKENCSWWWKKLLTLGRGGGHDHLCKKHTTAMDGWERASQKFLVELDPLELLLKTEVAILDWWEHLHSTTLDVDLIPYSQSSLVSFIPTNLMKTLIIRIYMLANWDHLLASVDLEKVADQDMLPLWLDNQKRLNHVLGAIRFCGCTDPPNKTLWRFCCYEYMHVITEF